jgi:hypothetical protein
MKYFLLSCILYPTLVWARTSESPSLLDKTVQIQGFGSIKYREPVVTNDEFPILLIHGIYGGYLCQLGILFFSLGSRHA